MTSHESRFETDPEELVDQAPGLPPAWTIESPDVGGPADGAAADDSADAAADDSADDSVDDLAQLTRLLRGHEQAGRGWAGAGRDDILVEVSARGLRTRENVVVRDPDGVPQAWGSVHDRARGRMLFVHVVARDLDDDLAQGCSKVLFDWAVGQAREVGAARGLTSQQIDTGAFADDQRQQRWLAQTGFTRVRTWWQMSRSVTPEEAGLVPDSARWEDDGVVIRLVDKDVETDLRAVHDVLEAAFADHFNSKPESFDEFLHRLREEPGHRWDHWWLAEVDGESAGALVGSETGLGGDGPGGSYVDYIGVVEAARGLGVAKSLLRTILADAAGRGRDRVGLEVDADSPTGADRLYRSLGWETAYITESWHRDVPVEPES